MKKLLAERRGGQYFLYGEKIREERRICVASHGGSEYVMNIQKFAEKLRQNLKRRERWVILGIDHAKEKDKQVVIDVKRGGVK